MGYDACGGLCYITCRSERERERERERLCVLCTFRVSVSEWGGGGDAAKHSESSLRQIYSVVKQAHADLIRHAPERLLPSSRELLPPEIHSP